MDNFLQIANRHTGEILRMKRMRDADGQTILLLEGLLPPGTSGPPFHVHFAQREEGTVAAGTIGIRLGDEKLTVESGGSAVFPAGTPHTWWNAGDDLLEFNGRAVPAGDLDRYIEAIFAVLNSSPTGRPSLFYIAHVAWRHRHTQATMSPPRVVQQILFPLILTLGDLLGKYSGTNWPGSPESCQGAPEPPPADA